MSRFEKAVGFFFMVLAVLGIAINICIVTAYYLFS